MSLGVDLSFVQELGAVCPLHIIRHGSAMLLDAGQAVEWWRRGALNTEGQWLSGLGMGGKNNNVL